MQYSIHYHPQAEAALSSLDQDELSRIIASIRQLGASGLSNAAVHKLNSITDGAPTYALRADNDLRVVFTATNDVISVLDVLNWRFAKRYG